MSSAFSIALSSLQAESEAINTTGQNLANINTTGYKGSEVAFRDLVYANLGSTGSFGMGVTGPTDHQIFSQGSLISSTSPWAGAIQGNGFFMLKGSSGQAIYTRDGNFALSNEGVLQTMTGAKVQGWTATSNGIDTAAAPSDIVVDQAATVSPQATSNLSFTVNLDAAGDAATGSGNISVPAQVTDSLGNTHILTVSFVQSTTAPNSWSYNVTIPTSDLSSGTGAIASGTLAFNPDGTIASTSPSSVPLNVTNLADGANNLSISWNLQGSTGNSLLTQYAQKSSYGSLVADGNQAGILSNVGLGDNGQIVASFSNGQKKTIGQVALASFRNQDSLQSIGNNDYAATINTALPSIGAPQTGDRGTVVAGALEGSNVDIATQFTNLITFQRGYQASSRVITTETTMFQDLLNVIR
ncbi:MAG: flagellar hook protein FlgE [Acidobacteriaceae bacterium]|nr:flagellar hook protein FlgE [Acidobacteriaceae bacterium]